MRSDAPRVQSVPEADGTDGADGTDDHLYYFLSYSFSLFEQKK